MILLNILLIDDHRLFAESLSLTLKQSMKISCLKIIESEKDYYELIHNLELSFFDVVLLDINLEKLFSVDGFELAKRMLRDSPKTKLFY